MASPIPAGQIDELKQIWFDQVEADCERIGQLIEALSDPSTASEETSDFLFRIFHDIKGQAGLFGYPLLAVLGAKFCAYWRDLKDKAQPDAHDLHIARAHLLVLRFILEKKLEGCGGATGATIMGKLDAIIAIETK